MLENGKKLQLTVEEGNILVTLSSLFHLPEKLDKDNVYSIPDRSIAGEEVCMLFRELRAYSPMMQSEERLNRFGPLDAWKEVVDPSTGQTGKKMVKRSHLVSIRLNEEILSGIMWCLLVGLHPSSQLLQPVQVHEEVLWPVAKKIGRARVLREIIGITTSAQLRRWKSDEDYNPAFPEEKSDSKS